MLDLKEKTLQPKGKRIIIEHLKNDEKTKSGIIIADTVAMEFTKAMIRKVGDEVVKVKEGDKILVLTGIGRDIEVDGKPMKIILEHEIEAVI